MTKECALESSTGREVEHRICCNEKERTFEGECYFCAPVELLITLGVLLASAV